MAGGDRVDISFQKDFDAVVTKAVRKKLVKIRDEIKDELIQPQGPDPDHVYPHGPTPAQMRHWFNDTGALNKSIKVTLIGGTITVSAGTHYAKFLEYGWRAQNGKFIGPFAFLRPAILKRRGDF